MKLMIIVGLFLTNILLPAHTYANITTDINSGLLPVEAAQRAHDNDEKSENVVQQLFDNNVDIVKSVQTVAKEWSTCEDTYSAVRKGVQIAPERADEIVAAIATIRGCRCNAQSFWARSRLEQRLRPRIQRALVEISSSCSCASAGIEAAIEIVPNQTEDMIDAVIVAKNRAARTADSIGQIGVIPDRKFWGDSQIKTKDTNLIRNTDICKGDHDEHDEFEPRETWGSSSSESVNSVFNDNKKLGYHKLICEDEDKEENKQEEDENKDEKLLISQYLEGQGSNQALEIYNGSDETVDLLLNNYQLEIYFHGYDFPGEVIQLKGVVEPQSTFVVSDANAAADITRVANQKVNGLIFKGADAVVLKAGIDTSPCECSVSTVASAINGIDKDNNGEEPVSQTKKDFIKRIEQHYENSNIQTTIVDSIGQILVNEGSDDREDKPIVEDKTLRRVESTCKGDRIEMDEFVIHQEWQSYAKDNFLDSGNFNKKDCLATRKDLLLSEFIEGSDNNAMVELYNGTARPIDFSNEKYYLEIYNDDDENPDKKIYLKGKIETNGVFVIAHNDADDALKDISQQTTGELDLEDARAVVLKKVVLPAYQACYTDISIWLREQELEEIIYTLTPTLDPGTGPTSDDDPRDGDDGGELASPN